jgi:RHS repeat-associated protein
MLRNQSESNSVSLMFGHIGCARLFSILTVLLSLIVLASKTANAQSYMPTGTAATVSGSNIVVTWNPVQDAVSYNIYRGTSSNGEGATAYAAGLSPTSTYINSYTDSSVTSGTTYYYKVTAVVFNGEGPDSKEVSATADSTLLAAPELKVSPALGVAKLSWSAVTGATSYNIYRSQDNYTYLNYIKNVGSTTFSDSNVITGETYYYYVVPVRVAGSGSRSNTVQTDGSGSAPGVGSGLRVAAGNNVLSLSWATIPGASSYNLYRGTTSGGEGMTPYVTGIGGNSYNDYGAANGTTYYYKYSGLNASGEGALSSEVSAEPSTTPPLPAPIVAVVSGSGSVTLNWQAVTGAVSYNVYQSTDNSNFTLLFHPTTTTYKATGLTNGTTYYYIVCAVDANGQGYNSSTVPAVPNGVGPTGPTELRATAESGYITLGWNYSSGATSYNLYRSTASGGEGSSPYATNFGNNYGGGYSGNDGSVTSGTTYYYEVTAVNGISEGAKSAEVKVTAGSTLLASPFLTLVPGNGKITLNWNTVSGATSYDIYRSLSTSNMVSIAMVGNVGTYTDSTVTNGVTYYYLVGPISAAAGEGSDSNTIQAVPGGATTIGTPVIAISNAGSTALYVNWEPVPGATSYYIYEGTTAGGEATAPIANVTGNYAYIGGLTTGQIYYFKVAATNPSVIGSKSNEASGEPNGTTTSAPVLSGAAGMTSNTLNWTSATGATGYSLFRTAPGYVQTLLANTTTALTYTDSVVSNNVAYTYQVYANTTNGLGAESNSVTLTPTTGSMNAPTGVSATSTYDSYLNVSYNSVSGATSYNIYRSTTSGNEGTTPYANTTGDPYLDTNVTYGDNYYYKVAAVGPAGTSALSAEVSATSGGPTPDAPILSGSATSAQVMLTWSSVSGADDYLIGKSTQGTPTIYEPVQTGTTFADSSVSSGVLYSYVVYAENSDGTGPASNTIQLSPSVAVLPAPADLIVSPISNGLEPYWNPVTGASSYNLYRSTTSGGEGSVPYATGLYVGYNDYNDTNVTAGQQYYYEVTAVNGYGESAKSNERSGEAGAEQLSGPALQATATSTTVVLNWSSVSGATSYDIFRSLSSNSSFTSVLDSSTSLTYTDSNVTSSTTYYYEVEAVNGKGNGHSSNVASATPHEGLLPAPAGLNAQEYSNQININWSGVTDASAYNVYRSTTSGGEGSQPIATTGSTYFDDYSVTNATKYYYEVTAVNYAGESPKSSEVSAEPGAQSIGNATLLASPGSGSATLTWNTVAGATSYTLFRDGVFDKSVTTTTATDTGLANGTQYSYVVYAVGSFGEASYGSNTAYVTPGATAPAAPTIVADGSLAYGIRVSWTTIPGAGSYNIYRSTVEGNVGNAVYVFATNGTGAPGSSVPSPAGPIQNYVDGNVSAGTTYYYTVSANNSAGTGAESNVADAASPSQGDPDFLLTASPQTITIADGYADIVTLYTPYYNGLSGNTTFTLSGLPTGVTATFYPAVSNGSGSYVTVTVAASAAAGTYPLTVTAVNGSTTHTTVFSLTVSTGVVSNAIRAQVSGFDDELPAGLERITSQQWSQYLSGSARSQASHPFGCKPLSANTVKVSLLNELGTLDSPIPSSDVALWTQMLHKGGLTNDQSAQLHLWLGEYALGHDQHPEEAVAQLVFARRIARSSSLRGLAAYDTGLSLFYEGAYAESRDDLSHLLKLKNTAGFDRNLASGWERHASACAGFHASRSAAGIPEPPRLDPRCGVAAIAASLASLGLPSSEPYVMAHCKVTGEGSSLLNLMEAGKALGVNIRPVSADDQGLMALPKPVVAYVERDHFISVISADKSGVSFLCSDCGPWPGGRVDLTWTQWHLLDASRYAVITKPSTANDAMMQELAALDLHRSSIHTLQLAALPRFQLASTGALGSVFPETLEPTIKAMQMMRHVAIDDVNPGGTTCGDKPDSPECEDDADCPDDNDPCPGSDGPSDGDPVNLATQEENYGPPPDFTVYNPHGLSVTWGRVYASLRSSYYASAYQFDDFGSGWSQSYNVGVYDSSGGLSTGGTKYVYMPNGSNITFTAPSVPSASTPTVACTVEAGAAAEVIWNYSAANAGGYYTVTFPDRSKWVTSGIDSTVNCYLLHEQLDRNGNGLEFYYTPNPVYNAFPLLSYINDLATGTTLLTVKRTNDGTGNIAYLTDNTGRSMAYHSGYYNTRNVPNGYPQYYQQLDHVGVISPAGTLSPTDRYRFGYSEFPNTEGYEEVPFLTDISVPSPTGTGLSTSSFSYDASTGQLISRTDGNGNTRTYESVDSNGNPNQYGLFTKVTVTNASDQTVYTFTSGYDNNMNETSLTNGAGALLFTNVFSDPNDPFMPSTSTDANGNVQTYTYDAFGNTLTYKSARGTTTTNTVSYSNFPLGELTSSVTGTKSPTSYTYYEPSGLLKTVTTPSPGTTGSTSTVSTTYTYDSYGNLLTEVAPGNNSVSSVTTTYNYTTDGTYTQAEGIGEPVTITDGLGHVKHYRYDNRSNITTVTDAIGNSTTTTYDLANQPLVATYPTTGQSGTGHSTDQNTYIYDGGPLQYTDTYNETGSLIRSMEYVYGEEGELLQMAGSTEPTTYTYDAMYRKTSVTDGDGNTTTFAFNPAGFLALESFPNNNTSTGYDEIQYPSYDALGDKLERIDGNGVVTHYAYSDPSNFLTSITYPASTSLNTTLTYDTYGREASISNGNATTTYSFDDNDLLTKTSTKFPAITAAQVVSYTFNPDGSRLHMVTGAGNYIYSRDGAQRLTSIENPNAETTTYSYLNNDWISSVKDQLGITANYTYNARGLVTDLLNENSSDATMSQFGGSTADEEVTYDSALNPVALPISIPSETSYGGSTAYTYDSRNELVKEQTTRAADTTNTFVYDGTTSGTSTGSGNPTTFRSEAGDTYNVDNQITKFIGTTGASVGNFVYDGNGNPTTYEAKPQTFDPENHLLTYSPNNFKAAYDGNGLRVSTGTGTGAIYYVYDEMTPVLELTSTGATSAYDTYGPTGLVSRRNPGVQSIYYTFDPFGNVVQRTSSTGSTLSTSYYDAFGVGKSTSTPTDPFGYMGQYGYYTDNSTGLILAGYRYYDPTTGRWLTRDPIGYIGGTNVYSYVTNDPVGNYDPFGLRPPDFYTGSVGVGPFVGWSGSVSVTNNGTVIGTPLGFGVGKSPTLVSGSLTANWLNQPCPPSEDDIENFLHGGSVNFGGGFIVGGGETVSVPSGQSATGVGLYSPQLGGSGSYTPDPSPEPEPYQPMPGDVPIGDGLIYNDGTGGLY